MNRLAEILCRHGFRQVSYSKRVAILRAVREAGNLVDDDGPWRYLGSFGNSHLFAAAVGRESDGPVGLFQVDESADTGADGRAVIDRFYSMTGDQRCLDSVVMRRFLWAIGSSRLLDLPVTRMEAP